MTLDELLDRVPEKLRPVIAEYGPAMLAMTGEQIWAWIDKLAHGRTDAAYRDILAAMDNSNLLGEWDKLSADWAEANADNAARIDLQRAAAAAVMKALLTVAIALVEL